VHTYSPARLLTIWLKDTGRLVLAGWNFEGLRAGILAGFVDTALSATPRESISAICASAIPTAAPAADQHTSLAD
jgi:hypothetical protein